MVNFDPTKGREQAGNRPALIVSINPFNHGPADLVIVLPLTSQAKGIPSHVLVQPPEGGLNYPSYIKCEDVRSISKRRLSNRLGGVTTKTMTAVEDRLQILLGL
jgi:mRNA interferase MazF